MKPFLRTIRSQVVLTPLAQFFDVAHWEISGIRYQELKDAWIEMPLENGWMVALRILVQHGMPIIGELRVFPHEPNLDKVSPSVRKPGEWSASALGTDASAPDGGITMSLVRQIKLGQMRSRIGEILSEFRKKWPKPLDRVLGKSVTTATSGKAAQTKKTGNERRGRPRLPDAEFLKIADYYAKRCAETSLSPVADTAKRFKISKPMARAKLHEARRRGFLSKGQRGVGWGELTTEAKQLLKRR